MPYLLIGQVSLVSKHLMVKTYVLMTFCPSSLCCHSALKMTGQKTLKVPQSDKFISIIEILGTLSLSQIYETSIVL